MPLTYLSKPFPDQEILRNLQQDGKVRERGEEQLFSSYAYFVPQAMLKYSFSEEEGLTIYSDTILAVIPQIRNGSFQGRSSLKTWIYQVFHNKCVDLVRKKTTIKSRMQQSLPVSDLLHQFADPAKNIIQELMEKNDYDRIREKLEELGENCRQLLMLWASGLNDAGIASRMEYKTSDVVKTSRMRCMNKLRQLYLNNLKQS